MNKKIIAVIGERDPSPELYMEAEEVGRLLAERGITVLTGGYGGIMEAVSQEAKSIKAPFPQAQFAKEAVTQLLKQI